MLHSCHVFALACPCPQDPLQMCWGLMCSAGKSPVEVEPVWKGKQVRGLMHHYKPIEGGRTPARASWESWEEL